MSARHHRARQPSDDLGNVAVSVWQLTKKRRAQRFHGESPCPQLRPPSATANPQHEVCGECSELWLATLEELGLTPEAETCPGPPAGWHTLVESRFADALRRWEGATLGLTQRPERTFHQGYVQRCVPDAITRELLLQAHWWLRAENRPEGRPLPVSGLAAMLSQARDALANAGYPEVSVTAERALSPRDRRMLGHLRERGDRNLDALDRGEGQVARDLDAAIAALLAGGTRARDLVGSQIDPLVSQRLAASTALPLGPDDDGDAGGDPIAETADPNAPRTADAEALLRSVIAEVTAAVDSGEPVDEALRTALRKRHGWDEGGAVAQRLLSDHGEAIAAALGSEVPA